MNQAKLPLRGDRNQCTACLEYFNSSAAFTKHRSGDYGRWVGGRYVQATRRCLSVSMMAQIGMCKNKWGYWVTAPMPNSRNFSL